MLGIEVGFFFRIVDFFNYWVISLVFMSVLLNKVDEKVCCIEKNFVKVFFILVLCLFCIKFCLIEVCGLGWNKNYM